MYAIVAYLAFAAPPQAPSLPPVPDQAPPVRPDPAYKWEPFNDGDVRQIALMKDGKQQGVWVYAEQRYYRRTGYNQWVEERPPVPPPTTQPHPRHIATPTYQPAYAPSYTGYYGGFSGGANCGPRG